MPILGLPVDPSLAAFPRQGEIAILDLEYTAWEGSEARRWSEAWEWREIVQVGALMVEASTFSPRSGLDLLVRPMRNPQLSSYFQELTGISQQRVELEGKTFSEAIMAMVSFLSIAEIVVFNGEDGQVLRENCALQAIALDLNPDKMLNFRPLLARSLGRPISELTSSKLPSIAGVRVNGRAHSALHDCHAIAAAFARWRATGLL